jgi:hypothetical protein
LERVLNPGKAKAVTPLLLLELPGLLNLLEINILLEEISIAIEKDNKWIKAKLY